MSQRTNAGYIITDSVHVGDTEFVLGVSQHIPNDFVTWRCSNGNYYWGNYHSNLFSAQKDLVERAAERVAEIQDVLDAKKEMEPGYSPLGESSELPHPLRRRFLCRHGKPWRYYGASNCCRRYAFRCRDKMRIHRWQLSLL